MASYLVTLRQSCGGARAPAWGILLVSSGKLCPARGKSAPGAFLLFRRLAVVPYRRKVALAMAEGAKPEETANPCQEQEGEDPEQDAQPVGRRPEENVIAVALGEEMPDVVVRLAVLDHGPNQPAHVDGDVGGRLRDRLVLADDAADFP